VNSLPVERRKLLKQKESRNFLKQLFEAYGPVVESSGKELKIETSDVNGKELIYFDGKPSVIRIEGRLYPTLVSNELLRGLPKVVVDMGAIPHICNGADIMAPGVRRIEGNFPIGAAVVIIEDRYGKSLAVGETTQGSDELRKMRQGKVVLNRHYVGDDIWKMISSDKS
jgi:PUA domain protein